MYVYKVALIYQTILLVGKLNGNSKKTIHLIFLFVHAVALHIELVIQPQELIEITHAVDINMDVRVLTKVMLVDEQAIDLVVVLKI